MTRDQQRDWERLEQEKQDMADEAARTREAAEEADRAAARRRRAMDAERQEWANEAQDYCDRLSDALGGLADARGFIDSKGLTGEFHRWLEERESLEKRAEPES
jgi:hypothetical protein